MSRIIVVDLDETLVTTDLLLEGVWRAIRKRPGSVFLMIAALSGSKLDFKLAVERLAPPLDASILPYNPEVIQFLDKSKKNNAIMVLATASPESWAQAIQDHLLLFDFVLASSPENGNLKGSMKRDLLIRNFPDSEFAYIGDSMSDIPLWESAKEVVFAGKSKRTRRAVTKKFPNHTAIASASPDLRDWSNQIRIHQWTKNLLVFLPMLLTLTVPQQNFVSGLAAFFAFGFVASSSYIFNDLLDIEADRSHPEKKTRPIARGVISIPTAILWMAVLATLGLTTALIMGNRFFLLCLALYAILNLSYSLFLKKLELFDVVALSMLYLIRIVAGGVATATMVSHWLIVFAFFVFLGLGFLKRYSELLMNSDQADDTNTLIWRGYSKNDTPIVGALGVGFSVISTGMLALYIDQTIQSSGPILWLLVPLWSLWIMRPWLLAHRGMMPSDPVEYAFRNPYSLVIAIALVVVFYASDLLII